MLLLAACSDDESKDDKDAKEETKEDKGTEEPNAEGEDMPEPDLEGIPKVVAEANGDEVSKEDFEIAYQQQFQQLALQAQMSGEEIDQDDLKKQVAENLVSQKLLIQEADKKIKEVSDEDIDKAIEELLKETDISDEEELFALFKEQGMEKEEVMKELEKQVKVDKLIKKEAGDVDPSKEDVKQAYDDIVKEQEQMSEGEDEGQEVPPFDEVKEDIKNDLSQKKQIEATEKLLEKLRDKAEVEIFLEEK